MGIGRLALLVTAAGIAGTGYSAGAERPQASDVWKIALGQPVTAIPDSFAEFACGTNGGPPATPLEGFSDFAKCRPEADGLREVYFRYDDELEYWAKANNQPELIAASGTKVYDFPVIMSVLVDEAGVVMGLRLVSDPRDTSVDRASARLLEHFLLSRFRTAGHDWTCKDLPASEGETDVDGEFVKQDCVLDLEDKSLSIKARYLRRPGERQVDPHTGLRTSGQFTSEVRFEMRVPS